MRKKKPAETIGALIARVRDDQGISQLHLAERLCASASLPTVTRHEVSRWERGERIPTAFWLGWLADALSLPLDRVHRAAGESRRQRTDLGGADQRNSPAVRRNWTEAATDGYLTPAS